MSNLEHYFENLLFHGRDCRDECNKKALTEDEQRAVEECAIYVKYTLFDHGVVLCKDCKYHDGTPGQPNILCYQMHDYDFCNYGEEKEVE